MGLRKYRLTKLAFPLAFILLLTVSAEAAPIFYSVNPTSSFLRHDPNDFAVAPLFINLGTLGVSAGDTILLMAVGDYCMMPGASCTQYVVGLDAAFTVNMSLALPSNLLRISAVSSGLPSVVTPVTYYNYLTTDISQDFLVPNGSWLSVVVPSGANFLAIGTIDSFYKDNTDPDGNLGIYIETVPEPGTVFLLASGLGLAAVFLRRLRA